MINAAAHLVVGNRYCAAAADIHSFGNEVEPGNIVYPMHPERIESIRRWAGNVSREQSHDVAISPLSNGNCGDGQMPIEELSSSTESDNMTMCSEDEQDIPERPSCIAHFLNLKNSNVYPSEPPYIHTPRPPSFARPQTPARPRFTRKTSMFSGSNGITFAGGTFTNCGGSVNVTHAPDGGRTIVNRSVDSNGNVTVTRILNSGTVNNSGRGQANRDRENEPHVRLESSVFSGIKNTVFTGGTFTHAPQFNCIVSGQGSPDTINSMPNGLPPRHLRSSSPPPAYTARRNF